MRVFPAAARVLFIYWTLLEGETFSYRRISISDESLSSLGSLISYSFSQFSCVQLTSDGSSEAIQTLGHLYENVVDHVIVNGINTTLEGCSAYVLMSKNFRGLKKMLRLISMSASTRVICTSLKTKGLDRFLRGGAGLFQDAEGLLVLLGEETTVYQFKQPECVFTELEDFEGLWEASENGLEDFRGRELRLSTFNCTLFSEFGLLDSSGSPGWVDGAEIVLVDEISRRLNFTYKIIVPEEENRWGMLEEGGNWSGGVLKLLAREEVDLAFCGLWFTSDIVSSGIQMSFPLGQVCLKLLVPRAGFLGARLEDIFTLFDLDLWLLVLLLTLLSSLFLRWITRLEKDHKGGTLPNKYESFSTSLFQMISILLLASFPQSARGAARHLLTWWVIFCLVVTTSFSSGLISHLTRPHPAEQVDTLRGLLQEGAVWITPFLPDLPTMLDLQDPVEAEWARRMVVVESEEEVKELRKERVVAMFGQEVAGGFFLDEHLPPDILEGFQASRDCVGRFFFGLAFRPGSVFALPFRKYIHRFHNGGLIFKALREEMDELAAVHPYCREVYQTGQGRASARLGLDDLGGAFLLWASGLALAAAAFLLELRPPAPAPPPPYLP